MGGRWVIGSMALAVTLDNNLGPSTEGERAPPGGEGREGRTRGDRSGEACSWASGFQPPTLSSACPLLVP